MLSARFDRIFSHNTGFATLDRLLTRQRANKSELLKVLERPDIPLHTNGSENDVRCHVTKRKISGGTRSDIGRDCRDAFLGLLKTCGKNGVKFWDCLGAPPPCPRLQGHPRSRPNRQRPRPKTALIAAESTAPKIAFRGNRSDLSRRCCGRGRRRWLHGRPRERLREADRQATPRRDPHAVRLARHWPG